MFLCENSTLKKKDGLMITSLMGCSIIALVFDYYDLILTIYPE